MMIRNFDWRDLPALHRYRNQYLYLDTIRLLTHGPQLMPASALVAYLALATGVFTFMCQDDSTGSQMIGQVIHPAGSTIARLSFLAPASAMDTSALPSLLDFITQQIGERGAYNLLAEVDESHESFDSLRRAGMAIYARQRIWQLTKEPCGDACATPWRGATSRDVINARSLYCNLVPNLVQQVEPPPASRMHGVVYWQESDLLGYVEVKYGQRGIWVQPFIHPDFKNVTARLVDLLQNLPNRRSRPVYICIRTYQSWLESALEELGAEEGPLQAVMVKRLAIQQKVSRAYALPALEGRHPEISAPIAQSKTTGH